MIGVSIFHIPLIFAKVKIPVIVVFTKYDPLVVSTFALAATYHLCLTEKVEVTLANRANSAFKNLLKSSKSHLFPFQRGKKRRKSM
jgi:hypothetical protein